MQKTFTDVNFERKDTFTVTDTFPEGYVVWPIGRRNFPHPGFVPLARTTEVPFQVSLKGLMALRCATRPRRCISLKRQLPATMFGTRTFMASTPQSLKASRKPFPCKIMPVR